MPKPIIRAYSILKKSCAIVNMSNKLDHERGKAII